MHPKDIVKHIHSTLRQASPKRDGRVQTLAKPTTCVIQSEELYKLNLLLQSEFPTIYELIGGIEGLLMCVDKGSRRLSEIIDNRASFYDSFVGETYTLLDEIATTECEWSGNDYIIEELNKEFMSWGFSDAMLRATDEYMDLLSDELSPVLQKQNNEVTVVCIMQSPLRGVYYIQIDPD